jgi:hypothetical protein
MQHSVWSITFGDYEFIVNRRTLTFRLTETKTGTLWADGISLGWMEIRHCETGEITRQDFGAMRQVSVSEKAGPQGKRILFGLDCDGVPVDVYLICSMREVQIQVEANRDTGTHLVHGFGLVPGLCAVPHDGASYLVIPHGEGAILFAKDAPPEPRKLQIWDARNGVNMPFVGAVRRDGPPAPASGGDESPHHRLASGGERAESLSGTPIYGDGGGLASSALALITDSAYGLFHLSRTDGGATLNTEYERDPERRRLDLRIVPLANGDHISVALTYREKLIGEGNHLTLRKKMREREALSHLAEPSFWHHLNRFWVDTQLLAPTRLHTTRWDVMERDLQSLLIPAADGQLQTGEGGCDWANVGIDLIIFDLPLGFVASYYVPLYAVVYRDCVVTMGEANSFNGFLSSLTRLRPCGWIVPGYPMPYRHVRGEGDMLLWELYRLTFSAFLTAHRFLTADFLVEEAIYSDKTRVVINQSDTEPYETEEFALPPLGFYVRHRQLEAHDALCLGETIFPIRAWRVRQAKDGKPLEQSTDIEVKEFPL